jgi:hypothetical protein
MELFGKLPVLQIMADWANARGFPRIPVLTVGALVLLGLSIIAAAPELTIDIDPSSIL